MGRVTAGTPLLDVENTEGYLWFEKMFSWGKHLFALQVRSGTIGFFVIGLGKIVAPLLVRAEKVTRAYGLGSILSALGKEVVLSRIVFGVDGRFILQTQEWGAYWRPLYEVGLQGAAERLDALHETWREYIRSDFCSSFRQEYCFRYFLLLDVLLNQSGTQPACKSRQRALQCALAFECFGIAQAGQTDAVLAAGTTTLRNPCYLLAKLKTPEALDDCQFLPLVTVAGSDRRLLFYHYRQHKLYIDSENSLLLYICASQAERDKSFYIVNILERQIGQGIDPRAGERAKRIVQRVVIPYLKAHLPPPDCRGNTAMEFELVDLGAGSGILAARLCKHVCKYLLGQRIKPRFRVWMVDLSLTDPGRFFARKQLSKVTDCVAAVGVDYRHWFSTKDRLPHCNGLRVGLVSRFFNNLSEFTATSVSPACFARRTGSGTADIGWKECLPSRCLRSDGEGPEALLASSSRMRLDSGRSFAQASLSQYFRGLDILSHSNGKCVVGSQDANRIFLCLRRFRPECLLTCDGASVLERLLEDCSLVIVQDADLRPQDLQAHRGWVRLSEVVAIDMTRTLGLKGHYSYALLRSNDPALKLLTGQRLW